MLMIAFEQLKIKYTLMKKSTIMITAAVLIILGSLTAFNLKIKQIYLTGSYKSRFNGMDFTPMNGLENVDIQYANRLGIRIEQGDKEGVWIREDYKKNYVLAFNQHTLKLDVTKKVKEEDRHFWGDVIIITRTLKSVQTTAFLEKGQNPTFYSGTVDLKNFKVLNLDLQVSLGVTVSLYKMQLDTLNAVVGDTKSGNASLFIASDTKINSANLNVPGKSLLTLANPTITKAIYNLSDSATVSVNGKLVQLIK